MIELTYMEKRVAAKEAAKDYIVLDGLTYFDPLWHLGTGWLKEGLVVLDETPWEVERSLRKVGYAVAKEGESSLKNTLFRHDRNCAKLSAENKLELLLNAVSNHKDKLDHVSLVDYNNGIWFSYIAKEVGLHLAELEDDVVKAGVPVLGSKAIVQQMIDESRIHKVG